MDDVSEKIAATIRREKLLGRKAKILVGVSGGVDSVVLLNVLAGMAESTGWRLGVVHVNHGLRGRASGDDARFVRRHAKALGLPCFVEKKDVVKQAKASGASIEMAARDARHQAFRQIAKEFGSRVVALAHHRDDQVEQFFLRLFRGAGLDGLSGMNYRTEGVLGARLAIHRPMLDVSREEIMAYAKRLRLPFREDATNADVGIHRNRVRNELLPHLEKDHSPAIKDLVVRTMESLRGDSECISWLVEKTTAAKSTDWEFDELPVGLRRRLILKKLRGRGLNGNFDMVEELLAGRIVEMPGGRRERIILNAKGEIEGVPEHDDLAQGSEEDVEIPITGGQHHVRCSGCLLQVRRLPSSKMKQFKAGTEFFDAAPVGDRVILRRWRAGDRYRPIGLKGSRKLQDCFTDTRVPKTERHQRVVMTSADGEIMWVEGLRIAEQYKVTAQTKRIVELRWKRGNM